VGIDPVVGDLDHMMGITLKLAPGHQFLPLSVPAGQGLGTEAALQRGGCRIVSGEMAGVDIDRAQPPPAAEPEDRQVVTGPTLAAALPTIHPLAVVVVLVGNEDRWARVDHALLRGEKIIAGIDHLSAQAGLCQVEPATREGLGLRRRLGPDHGLAHRPLSPDPFLPAAGL
jgi:hypothetical protein